MSWPLTKRHSKHREVKNLSEEQMRTSTPTLIQSHEDDDTDDTDDTSVPQFDNVVVGRNARISTSLENPPTRLGVATAQRSHAHRACRDERGSFLSDKSGSTWPPWPRSRFCGRRCLLVCRRRRGGRSRSGEQSQFLCQARRQI